MLLMNEVPSSKEGLLDRVRRAWRINQGRLYNQTRLIAVYRGEILEEYEVLGYRDDELEPKRVAFELKLIESDLKGKKIEYKTANPCTIIEVENLNFI